ncbi:MAG: DNA-binding protein [Gammaproteobacteria bacterium]
MSRLGITFEEVAEAALHVQNNGQIPTIDKIRNYLGGTGSNTTISKYLSMWRTQSTSALYQRDNRQDTPDIVKSAVDKVWQEIKDQADAEVAAVKEQAKEQIEAAENKAVIALNALSELQDKNQIVINEFNALQAQKELLALDIKALRHEHQQLQDKHQYLQEKHAEADRLMAHHLSDIKVLQQKELSQLADQYAEREKLLSQINDTVKSQAEHERQQQLLIIDGLKTTQQKQLKQLAECEVEMKAQATALIETQTSLAFVQKERDDVLQRLFDENKKWLQLMDKTLVPDEIVDKMINMPAFDLLIEKLDAQLSHTMDKQFIEFTEWVDTRVKLKV